MSRDLKVATKKTCASMSVAASPCRIRCGGWAVHRGDGVVGSVVFFDAEKTLQSHLVGGDWNMTGLFFHSVGKCWE